MGIKVHESLSKRKFITLNNFYDLSVSDSVIWF